MFNTSILLSLTPMNKPVAEFLEAIAQRLIGVVSELVVSTVEATTAAQQAEQHARLEDLARSLESDNKGDIAALLRAHTKQLLHGRTSGIAPDQALERSATWRTASFRSSREGAGHDPEALTAGPMSSKRRRRTAALDLLSSVPMTEPVKSLSPQADPAVTTPDAE